MTKQPYNRAAFPIFNDAGVTSTGLTKREYFAAMALQGYLSTYDFDHEPGPEHLAVKAVAYADALIAELNKPKP